MSGERYRELGRYPLYIDIVISMLKYWIRLHEDKTNCILKAALDEKSSTGFTV
jgi:hypothetical protein